MTILDQMLSQFGGVNIGELAGRLGITEAQVESALGALGTNMPQPGSTIDGAAQQTGLPTETIRQLLDAIGGEAMLQRITGALSQGGGLEAITSGLFGKN
jgi:predicted ArsR family transcriptional regulator